MGRGDTPETHCGGSDGRFVEQDAPAYVAASGDLASGHDVEQDLGGAAPPLTPTTLLPRSKLIESGRTRHTPLQADVPCCGSTDTL